MRTAKKRIFILWVFLLAIQFLFQLALERNEKPETPFSMLQRVRVALTLGKVHLELVKSEDARAQLDMLRALAPRLAEVNALEGGILMSTRSAR